MVDFELAEIYLDSAQHEVTKAIDLVPKDMQAELKALQQKLRTARDAAAACGRQAT